MVLCVHIHTKIRQKSEFNQGEKRDLLNCNAFQKVEKLTFISQEIQFQAEFQFSET